MTVSISDLNKALTDLRSHRNSDLAVLYRTASRVANEARQFIGAAKMAEKAMEKKQEALDLIAAEKAKKAAEKANDETITA